MSKRWICWIMGHKTSGPPIEEAGTPGATASCVGGADSNVTAPSSRR